MRPAANQKRVSWKKCCGVVCGLDEAKEEIRKQSKERRGERREGEIVMGKSLRPSQRSLQRGEIDGERWKRMNKRGGGDRDP